MSNKKKSKESYSMRRRVFALVELLLLLSVLIIVPLILYFTNPSIHNFFQSTSGLDQLLQEYEGQSALIYIAIQVLQVIITILPGQFVQAAGGYVFGIPLTMLYTLIGIVLGSSASFWIARLAGQRPMRILFGDEKIDKYCGILNSSNGKKVILLLYLIPGVPKDFVTYAAGLADIRFGSFIISSTIARFPAICGSILTGAFLRSKNYIGLGILWCVILASIVVILLLSGKYGGLLPTKSGSDSSEKERE